MGSAAEAGAKPHRIFYALGPGDVVSSYRHWRDGKRVATETSLTWSGQFFDFCRTAGHRGYAVSSHADAQRLVDGPISVENRPKRPFRGGIQYHLSQALYAISIVATAVRWRADTAFVDSGTTHWLLLAPLKLAGIRIIGVLHNVPWPAGFKPTGLTQRLFLATEGLFWRHIATAVISVSPEGVRQVRELAGGGRPIALQCRAQFERGDFANVPAPPPLGAMPLRVLFAGRIERSKGVFDIVEIAKILSREGCDVRFDVCGGGPALDELVETIGKHGLETMVRTHGRLAREELLKFYGACHVLIVPTRSDFCEGMPMVCAEAILAGRPVITSPVSNAMDVIAGAVIPARTDDPKSYAEAIQRVSADPDTYERYRGASLSVQEQFYDRRCGFAAALERALSVEAT